MDDNVKKAPDKITEKELPSYIEDIGKDPLRVTKKTANLDKEYEKDQQLVNGIFRYHELPGGTLSFVYRKHKKEPIRRYTLVDGQRYELPLGVAKHLNSSGKYPVHQYELDQSGLPSMRIGKYVRRYGFQSLEFIADEDFVVDQQIII